MSTEISKWGDNAMWTAEPMDKASADGVKPSVYLLGMNADPLGTIAAVSRIYRGGVARSLEEISDNERTFYFDDMRKSRLRAPFEFVKFHFLIEGVSRGFTHQMVRQRTACLTGDTVVHSERRSRRYTLDQLWETWNRPGGKTWVKNLRIRTATESGMIVNRGIHRLAQNGVRPVFELKTQDGRRIRATANHPFLRENGEFTPLGELKVGDDVVSNGHELATDGVWLKARVADGMSSKEIAALANCSASHVKKQRAKYGISGLARTPLGYKHSEESKENMRNAPRSKWSEDAKAAFSAWCLENRKPSDLEEWTGQDVGHRTAEFLYGYRLKEGCVWCGETSNELAHVDGNPDNNAPGNVQPMCYECHRAMDRGTYPKKTYATAITSIEPAGEEMTYDLGMAGEYPWFVANGLVVHNTFGQESLRFAVKDNLASEMHIPPFIAALKDDDPRRVMWDNTVADISEGYMALVDAGVPAEDARGLLPTNVATRLHYSTDLNALMMHAGNRLCTQSQFEWRFVWAEIISALRKANTDKVTEANGVDKIYRSKDLLQLFRPICYQTGKCEFMSANDRFCSIRERVQANHNAGVGPEEWGQDHSVPSGFAGNGEVINAIRDEEWLLDINAARQSNNV